MDTGKAVLIGDPNVGKTSIFSRIEKNEFEEDYLMTISGAYTQISLVINGKNENIGLWDTAGQERFRNVVPMYFQKSNIIILVYDVTNTISFENIEWWFELAKDRAPDNFKGILIGNKTDLEEKRSVSFDEGTAKAQSLSLSFIETSARSGHGIDLLLNELVPNEKGAGKTTFAEEALVIQKSKPKTKCIC
jgi:Ras-related protein Rab-6A